MRGRVSQEVFLVAVHALLTGTPASARRSSSRIVGAARRALPGALSVRAAVLLREGQQQPLPRRDHVQQRSHQDEAGDYDRDPGLHEADEPRQRRAEPRRRPAAGDAPLDSRPSADHPEHHIEERQCEQKGEGGFDAGGLLQAPDEGHRSKREDQIDCDVQDCRY